MSVDRSRLPVPLPDPPFRFPRIVTRELDNGLVLRAIRHRAVPVVSVMLLVPGGSAVDPPEAHGLVSMTAGLLDEGSRGQSALDIADRVARIGGDFDVDAGLDSVVAGLTTLDRFYERGLELIRDIVTAPNLAADDFNRIRDLRLERFRQMRDHAGALADRAFAQALYDTHPYGHLPFGSEAAVSAMRVAAVRDLHTAMCVPAGATLVIAGDRDEDELLDRAAAVFESWRAASTAMPLDGGRVFAAPPTRPSLTLGVVPRPSAAQSELRIGHPCTTRATPDYHTLLILNTILGGDFVSRLNMNLRESKGYTYGVRSAFSLRRGVGPFQVQTSVGTDVTAAAIGETINEIRAIRDARPVTTEEVSAAVATLSKGYPRGFETAAQVARSVAQLALHNLPDSYFEEFVPRLLAVTPEDVTAAARKYVDPTRLATIVVGDLEKIHASLSGLGLGEPQLLTPAI